MAEVFAGRFVLLDPIGRGGSGSVWRAHDRRTGQVCALKVLRQRDAGDLIRFVREQSVRPDHPHLLAPYSWAAEDDVVVIAMPLARGGSVAMALADYGALSAPLVAELLRQLMHGLGVFHGDGWVHRDVKPANLMFLHPTTGRPELVLADFGIAVHDRDVRLTATGFVNGTPGFVAPEVATGGLVSPAQDIWAAARCALVMLAGTSPPPAEEVLAGTDPALAAVLSAMLDPDPTRRPGPAQVIGDLAMVPAPRDGVFRAADGQPFEVFDQLGPVPEGMGPTQRRTPPTRPGGPPPTRQEPGPPAASRDAASPSPGPPRSAASPSPAPAPAGAPEPGPRVPRRGSHAASGAVAHRSRARLAAGITAAGVLVAGGVAAVALLTGPDDPGGQAPGPDPSGPASTSGPTSSSGPASTSGSSGNAPATQQAPAPAPAATAHTGDPCSWAEENVQRTTPDGETVTCTAQRDGTFSWE